MALVDRLRAANEKYEKTFICKLMRVTLDPKLSRDDADAVIKIINSRPGDEGYVPNIRIAQALLEEGYDVSTAAVDRHRRGTCSCTRLK
jgi:hypothetical protein